MVVVAQSSLTVVEHSLDLAEATQLACACGASKLVPFRAVDVPQVLGQVSTCVLQGEREVVVGLRGLPLTLGLPLVPVLTAGPHLLLLLV